MQRKTITVFHLGFWIITQCIIWTLISCFGCIVLALLLVVIHGEQIGVQELLWLIQHDDEYLLAKGRPGQLVFLKHVLAGMPHSLFMPKILMPLINPQLLQQIWHDLTPYFNAILLGTTLLIIRLIVLQHWLLLFFLMGFVGLVDGLAQRAIRKANAGRESAFLYHTTKPLILFCFMVGIFIALVLPLPIQRTEWMVVGAALLFGLTVQMTAKRFKKYL